MVLRDFFPFAFSASRSSSRSFSAGSVFPSRDPDTLEKIAGALHLKRASDEYREFMDLAAASAGRIPSDLLSNPKLLARMPLLFRTARGRKFSEEDLKHLVEKLKEV